jgi:hypothetical protein
MLTDQRIVELRALAAARLADCAGPQPLIDMFNSLHGTARDPVDFAYVELPSVDLAALAERAGHAEYLAGALGAQGAPVAMLARDLAMLCDAQGPGTGDQGPT